MGAGAVGLAAALAVADVVVAGRSGALVVLPAALAVALLAATLLLGRSEPVPWALALLAGLYVAALVVRGSPLDTGSAVYGAGLLVAAELSYWSLELRASGRDEAGALARRGTILGGVALASLVLGSALLPLAAAPVGGGILWDGVGVAAASGVLGIVVWLAQGSRGERVSRRRSRPSRSPRARAGSGSP